GRPQVKAPPSWANLFVSLFKSENAAVRNQAIALAVTFGDPRAFTELRNVLVGSTDLTARQAALAALLGAQDKELAPVLHTLLGDGALRGPALRGLAAYDDPQTPPAILDVYAKLTPPEKRDALTALAARPAFARAMLDAVAAKQIAAADVSADIVRNLR